MLKQALRTLSTTYAQHTALLCFALVMGVNNASSGRCPSDAWGDSIAAALGKHGEGAMASTRALR